MKYFHLICFGCSILFLVNDFSHHRIILFLIDDFFIVYNFNELLGIAALTQQ
jgi:hypothetical protein